MFSSSLRAIQSGLVFRLKYQTLWLFRTVMAGVTPKKIRSAQNDHTFSTPSQKRKKHTEPAGRFSISPMQPISIFTYAACVMIMIMSCVYVRSCYSSNSAFVRTPFEAIKNHSLLGVCRDQCWRMIVAVWPIMIRKRTLLYSTIHSYAYADQWLWCCLGDCKARRGDKEVIPRKWCTTSRHDSMR